MRVYSRVLLQKWFSGSFPRKIRVRQHDDTSRFLRQPNLPDDFVSDCGTVCLDRIRINGKFYARSVIASLDYNNFFNFHYFLQKNFLYPKRNLCLHVTSNILKIHFTYYNEKNRGRKTL
ncbi:Hypothetical protein ACI5QL_00052 [Bacillus velezensis]